MTAATRWPEARATRGMGHAQLIRVDADGFTGGSDPRADGAALGIYYPTVDVSDCGR